MSRGIFSEDFNLTKNMLTNYKNMSEGKYIFDPISMIIDDDPYLLIEPEYITTEHKRDMIVEDLYEPPDDIDMMNYPNYFNTIDTFLKERQRDFIAERNKPMSNKEFKKLDKLKDLVEQKTFAVKEPGQDANLSDYPDFSEFKKEEMKLEDMIPLDDSDVKESAKLFQSQTTGPYSEYYGGQRLYNVNDNINISSNIPSFSNVNSNDSNININKPILSNVESNKSAVIDIE